MAYMRARQAFVYNGHNVAAGEVFALTGRAVEADRRVLIETGLAEDEIDGCTVGSDDPTVSDKSMRAKKKGTYRRRDLRAEE